MEEEDGLGLRRVNTNLPAGEVLYQVIQASLQSRRERSYYPTVVDDCGIIGEQR